MRNNAGLQAGRKLQPMLRITSTNSREQPESDGRLTTWPVELLVNFDRYHIEIEIQECGEGGSIKLNEDLVREMIGDLQKWCRTPSIE